MSQPIIQELTLLAKSGWRLIAFETFEEERALRILERVATNLERTLIPWTVAAGYLHSQKGAGSWEAGVAELEKIEEPAIIVFLDTHTYLHDPIVRRRLRDWLPTATKRKQTLILLGPVVDIPIDLSRETGHVSLPLPRAEELDHLFRRIGEFGDLSDDPEKSAHFDSAVRAALGLSGAEASRVFRKACALSGGLGPVTAGFIAAEKQVALRRTPALAFHESGEGLDQVGGLGELKSWLRERRRAFGEDARRFGLPIPRGLLLLGVQGCGKSLCAKAVALEWHFPLLRLDLASVFSGSNQSPEAAIREATAVAESVAPAVLWIDEIEKGFSAASGDAHTSRVFGSFLTWLAEKKAPVFVVATANDVASLPPELLRRGRFDELFFVDLPTVDERREILTIHLLKQGRDPKQFQLDMLAEESERLSGAELEQVVSAALYRAFSENRDLRDPDLFESIQETVPLYDSYEDRIKELRDWSRNRARQASLDVRMLDLFDSN